MYSLYRIMDSPTKYSIATFEVIDAPSPELAIAMFAKKYSLTILEYDGETVWMSTKDGADIQYTVTKREKI